ncbi:MAG: hypothetical protein COB02_15950 [Candidatus Cloacimonadota bacterium]|nr:MAG: hypothetical protein COB02_15950 [Candidatus Cloacimonadota bacterium]
MQTICEGSKLLKSNFPQFQFKHCTPIINDSIDTKCYCIDDKYVLLISSKPSVFGPVSAAKTIQNITPFVKQFIPKIYEVSDSAVLMEYVKGESLNRLIWKKLNSKEKESLCDNFIEIFENFKKIPLNSSFNNYSPDYKTFKTRYKKIKSNILSKVPIHVMQEYEHSVGKFINNPSNFEIKPSFVHNELVAPHIIIKDNRLSGLIDFGHSGIGDPAVDLSFLLMTYGKDILNRMSKKSTLIKELEERAQFYLRWNLLNFILIGQEHNEERWFYNHLSFPFDI